MASPLAPSTCRVDWWIPPITIGTVTIAAARLKVPLYLGSAPPLPSTPRDLCWLDTGAPLSVVPFHVHFHRVRWQPIPGISASWAGQTCDLGYVHVWLTTQQAPFLRGPFSLLAKFPRSDPPGDLMPVLLGLEFFLTHRAEFEMLLPPRQSLIRLQ
jgi:hypothetical protein